MTPKKQAVSKPGRGELPSRAKTRPGSQPISEDMKQWSALLLAELESWPKVTAKVFFGFWGLYRGDQMFAVLPRTRMSGNHFWFKIPAATGKAAKDLSRDVRVKAHGFGEKGWRAFEIESGEDLRGALGWLDAAYRAGGRARA